MVRGRIHWLLGAVLPIDQHIFGAFAHLALRGCYREAGRTFGDMPSRFDVVTCPGHGTMYGNR